MPTSLPRTLVQAPAEELVDYVLERYHAPLRDHLPPLIERVRRLEGQGDAPAGLSAHLEESAVGIFEHLGKEEKILFPMILGSRGHLAMMIVRTMMVEHADHLEILRRTRALTHDFTAPDGAHVDLARAYAELRRLEADLVEHIHIENDVLFARALRGEF